MPGAYLYGWNGAAWEKVNTDTNNALLFTPYSGGNAISSDVFDGGNVATTTRGLAVIAALYAFNATDYEALRTSAPADAHANPTQALEVQSYLMVYNAGATDWDRVRGDGNGNIYTMLRDGANQIDSAPLDPDATTERGLFVKATLMAKWGSSNFDNLQSYYGNTDATAGTLKALMTMPYLIGFNGTTWDRLRTYGTGILKVGRAEVGLSTAIKTADGAIGAVCNVYWITIFDSGGNITVQLNDSTNDTGTDKWSGGALQNAMVHCVFDPPIEFATDCFVDIQGTTPAVTVGYI